jgi:hypothetical protein
MARFAARIASSAVTGFCLTASEQATEAETLRQTARQAVDAESPADVNAN